ncbi:hypothetical protein BDQ12DRAFT_682901 [Crucibulum laeve]|uniref:Telomere-associated protein Rif1 N-terminal domain-containing protein n=1 Tax=Crucibulum laeve TaxID=68775 RepID=A0A5C3M234_9AGAR|nr:hypothetical protein BDQ12DRAFT_682901 [Crucibulum laeve]
MHGPPASSASTSRPTRVMPQVPQQEAPPEKPHILNLPNCFQSPIETLLESLDDIDLENVLLHDIAESYNALSHRIRAQASDLCLPNQHYHILDLLKEHSTQIYKCLKRDIRRAFMEPLPDKDSFYFDNSISEETLKASLDSAMLCHHALRILSNIFVFPSLYSLFSEIELRSLLHEILMIKLTWNIPTPHADKTRSLVIWILQVQQLPLSIISHEISDIIVVLKRSIKDRSSGNNSSLDAFKVIQNLLRKSPKSLFCPLRELLPGVLSQLLSEYTDCRIAATNILCAFTLAKLEKIYVGEHGSDVSMIIQAYIQGQTSKRGRSPLLLDRVTKIIAEPGQGYNVCWAATVTACFLVLSDFSLFSHTPSLRLFISLLAQFGNRENTVARSIHPHLWKIFIWAFSRIGAESNGTSTNGKKLSFLTEHKERCYRVVRQELQHGTGIGLAASLLRGHDFGADPKQTSPEVSESLAIAKDLIINKDTSARREGLMLLERFLSAIGDSSVSKFSEEKSQSEEWIISPELIDGTFLKISDSRALRNAVQGMTRSIVDHVRQLSAAEILHHWDNILDIWKGGVKKICDEGSFHLSDMVVNIWQALLLVQTRLIQEKYEHPTVPGAFSAHFALIVSEFSVRVDAAEAQIGQLHLIKSLWDVIKNVFSHIFQLSSPAEIILSSILDTRYALEIEAVRIAWDNLCSALISAEIPMLLHVLSARSKRREDAETTRELWAVVGRNALRQESNTSWQDLMSFLSIPITSWVLSNQDLEIWDATLAKAMSIARNINVENPTAISYFLRLMDNLEGLRTYPLVISMLLSYIEPWSHIQFLSIIDYILSSLYPPSPGQKEGCLVLISRLGEVLPLCPPLKIAEVLVAIQDGICCWMKDAENVLEDGDYNIVVDALYCGPISVLCQLPPSAELLHSLESFFISGFDRIPHPALGPNAFESFWRLKYHAADDIKRMCPHRLIASVKGWSDPFDTSLGEELSLGSGTQSTAHSLAPDSQAQGGSSNHLTHAGLHFFEHSGAASPVTRPRSRSATPIAHRAVSQHQESSVDMSTSVGVFSGKVSNKDILPEEGHSLKFSSLRLIPGDDADLTNNGSIKRSLVNAERPASSKRRKTITEHPPNPKSYRKASPRRVFSRASMPELATRSLSFEPHNIPASHPSPSQSMGNHSEKRCDRHRRRIPDTPSPRKVSPSSSASGLSIPSSDEYRRWEARDPVSMLDIQELQEQSVPVTDAMGDTNADDVDDFDDPQNSRVLLSPAVSTYGRCITQHRSQTEPTPSTSAVMRPTPLKRNQTASARLEALQRAYVAINDAEGASQVPVHDLVQATILVNKIGAALNDQLSRKLPSGPDHS